MATSKEVEILLRSRTIAVVGLSKDPSKESFSVSQYLKEQGYRIIPVNPTASEILGERAYPSLLEIPAEEAKRIDEVIRGMIRAATGVSVEKFPVRKSLDLTNYMEPEKQK